MRYILWSCVLLLGKLYAQSDLLYQNYTVENGLESNTIFDLFQDQRGYIYIAHDKGINTFNGLAFGKLSSEIESKTQSNITPFYDGELISRNFQGDSYIIRNDSLISFTPEITETLSYPTYDTDEGVVYMAQHNGFYYFNDARKPVRFEKEDFPQINKIWSYVVHKKIAYIVASIQNKNSLLAIDLATQKTLSSYNLPANLQVRFYKTHESVFWVNFDTGQVGYYTGEFVPLANLFQKDLTPKTKFTHLYTLKDGRHLVATFNGLFLFNTRWELEHHYLEGVSCSVIYEDMEGSLWIGTLQNGLYYIPSLQFNIINASSLPGTNVKFSTFKKFDSFLYAGTYDGKILQFTSKGNLQRVYDLKQNAEIQSFLITDEEIVLFCGALFIIDKKTGVEKKRVTTNATKSIYEEDGIMYLGTSSGLKIIEQNKQAGYLSSYWITEAFPIHRDRVIAQTTNGVILYHPNKNELTLVNKEGTHLCKYGDTFFFRERQALWKVTMEGTVEKVKEFSEKLVLLQSDEKGVYGLFDTQKMSIVYPVEVPLSFEADGSWLKEMKFMTSLEEGFCYANNSNLVISTQLTPAKTITPWLSTVKMEGTYTVSDTTYYLPYANNSMQLTLDLLPNYRDLGKGSVLYKIAPIEKEWVLATKKNHYQIDLIRLPPGTYTLFVKGTTSNGSTTLTKEYHIIVASPFYFQWWFLGLLLLFIILLMYVILRWRTHRMTRKNKAAFEKQQLTLKALNAELNAIRAQMNPHFIFNSLSAIQAQILNDDKLKAFENLSTFAVLLRQALQFTSEEFLTLAQELSFIRNYVALEQQRTERSFTYIETIDPTLDTHRLKIPSLLL
ncbi:MAG: histidine kinase, partial [Flavobacteriaceae bacterium]|nr:histidine kinase [Flavobacteriaceae bacterium]